MVFAKAVPKEAPAKTKEPAVERSSKGIQLDKILFAAGYIVPQASPMMVRRTIRAVESPHQMPTGDKRVVIALISMAKPKVYLPPNFSEIIPPGICVAIHPQ